MRTWHFAEHPIRVVRHHTCRSSDLRERIAAKKRELPPVAQKHAR